MAGKPLPWTRRACCWRIGSARWVSLRGPAETRKCSRQRQNFVVRHRYADYPGERGKSYSTPLAFMRVNPEKPRPLAFSSAGGSDQHAPGIRGSALSPSFPDKGGAQFQGRGVSQGTLHPEGHLVADASGPRGFRPCGSRRIPKNTLAKNLLSRGICEKLRLADFVWTSTMQVKLRIVLRLLALLIFSTAVAEAAEMPKRVGFVARIQGQVIELPQGFGQRPLRVGAPVHAQSKIKTGPDSRLEIRFTDGSKMLLGEWAHVDLDINLKNYRSEQERAALAGNPVSEPENPNSMVVNILAGTFRFVTGLIAKTNKRRVRFGTQVATIGVRGTDFFGGPLAAGMPPGEIHYGFMILDGAIEVENRHGKVTLDDAFEGTFLPMKGHKAPTPPSTWKQQAIDEAFASIAY